MQNIIKRDEYLNRIIDRKENGLIKVITGIRRCGKSFLLFNLFYDYLIESGVKEEQIITIALDDDTLRLLLPIELFSLNRLRHSVKPLTARLQRLSFRQIFRDLRAMLPQLKNSGKMM